MEIEATEIGIDAPPARVVASPDGVTLHRGATEHFFEAATLRKQLQLSIGFLSRPTLVAKIDAKRVLFRLGDGGLERMFTALGPQRSSEWAVAWRTKWFVPLGILFVLSSLPFPGDPAADIPDIPLNLLGMVLGVGLLGVAVLARVAPRPWLLLADSVWLTALLVQDVHRTVTGDQHYAWLIVDLLLVSLLVSGLRTYRALRAARSG